MTTRLEVSEKLKALKPILGKQFHVSNIGFFGSFADGTQNEDSDIDIIVEFSQPLGWEIVDLHDFLQKAFSRKVDLVPKNYIRDSLKDGILRQVIYV